MVEINPNLPKTPQDLLKWAKDHEFPATSLTEIPLVDKIEVKINLNGKWNKSLKIAIQNIS